MYLTEYQKVSIENFMGLWDRGSLDDIPPDHASDILNMAFARKREVLTRPGAGFSHNIPGGRPILRQFDAAFDNDKLIPLALDDQDRIWRLDNYTVLLVIPGMVDFDALNMNNHVYIAPMIDGSDFDPVNQGIYVWVHPNLEIRLAAGYGPPNPVTAIAYGPPGTGNVNAGFHGVAICWITDTGYVSPPSPVVVGTGPGPGGTNITVQIAWLSSPPPGVTGYMILVTKAQATGADALRAALYEYESRTDLTNTSQVLNFFDTDLVILASNDPVNGNLFNSQPRLPTGYGAGSVALIKYHGRMIIIGPVIQYTPSTVVGTYADLLDGRIFVSHPGAPENFDVLTGFLVVDAEFDGNIPRTGFQLFGVLYICKSVGTYSTQDNGSDPNDPNNPWVVSIVDGGIGAYHHAIGTITGSQPGLSFNSTAFLANRNGLFLFNGNVLRPELSWKIRGLWQQMTVGLEYQTRVTIDIYNDIFYVMLAVDGSLGPYVILAGDYSLGLDSQNIRWSIYQFPWPVTDIIMAAWPDPVGQSYYYLRLGAVGTIYKLDGSSLEDETWQGGILIGSTPINNYYQTGPLELGDTGAVSVHRFIRYRMAGQGTLNTLLRDQGDFQLTLATSVQPDPFPGNYKDIGIQINFTNEKIIVRFGMDGASDFVRMARLDVFGKSRWPTRPNA